MKLHGHTRQSWLLLMATICGFLGAAHTAQSECLSPSSASGDSATTVYRCLEQQGTTTRQDPITSPHKTTVVERGPASVPWFAPKPAGNTAETAAPSPQAQPAEPSESLPQAQPSKIKEIVDNKPDKKPVAQKKPARKKLVKLKPAKTKTTKALTAKTKPVKKTTKAKIASEEPNDSTIVWTRKDVPLGNRIVNWLGL